MLKRLASSLASVALIGLLTAASASAAREPNVPNESFFPRVGTSSYDAGHYDVDLSYAPSSGYLKATASIEATANRSLSDVVLDLDGLRVTAAEVDGEPAVVSPRPPEAEARACGGRSRRGTSSTVVVHYRGHPRKVIDPDGSPEGWYRTADGAIAVGEPVGTAAWLPCNNVPADKASFSVAITIPAGLQGVSNGRLLGVSRKGARRTFRWSETAPMSTYLAVVDIGRGRLVRSRIGSLPSWTLVDPSLAAESRKALAQLPEIVHFETGIFGPYPFDAARLDRRPGRTRLRAGDPDASDLRLRPQHPGRRPRDRAPVVRRLGRAAALAGNLAQRGLRDLDRMVLRRAPRRAARRARSSTTSTGSRPPTPASGSRPRDTRAPPRTSSRPRPTSAAG